MRSDGEPAAAVQEVSVAAQTTAEAAALVSPARERPAMEALQADFRRQGWNLAGANLLAASCWVAHTVFLYVRPRLRPSDAVYMLLPALLGALATGGLSSSSSLAGAAAGAASGGFYLLWKVGSWRPAEDIIRRNLDRVTQSRLVVELAAVCQANSIDPEDLDGLAGSLDRGGNGVVSQFHRSLLEFFRVQLKMQE